MVREMTIPVEGAKRGAQGKIYVPNIYARYNRDLSDKFYKPAKSVVLATDEYMGFVRKWLDNDLSDEDLYECGKIFKALEKFNQEVGETCDEFADKFEEHYKLVVVGYENADIPDAIRVCMITRKAKIRDTQRMLIMLGMNSLCDA